MKAIYIQSCKRNKVGLILLTFFSVTMKKEKGCIGCIMLCYGMGVTKVHPYEWLNWNWAFMFIEIVWSQGENCPFVKSLLTVIGESADVISKGNLLSTLDNNRLTHLLALQLILELLITVSSHRRTFVISFFFLVYKKIKEKNVVENIIIIWLLDVREKGRKEWKKI